MLIPPDKETGSERAGCLPQVTQRSQDSNQTLKPELYSGWCCSVD